MKDGKHGLRGLRGKVIATDTPLVIPRSRIGEAAAKKAAEEAAAEQARLKKEREEAQARAAAAHARAMQDEDRRIEQLMKEEAARAAIGTTTAAARAREARTTRNPHDILTVGNMDGTIEPIPRQDIPPAARTSASHTTSLLTIDMASALMGDSTVTGRMSSAAQPNQTWDGVPVATRIANSPQTHVTMAVQISATRYDGMLTHARPDIVTVDVPFEQISDQSNVTALRAVEREIEEILARRPAIVESIQIVTGQRSIERNQDVMRRQVEYGARIPLTTVAVTGFGDPMQLIAKAAQHHKQALRADAVDASRRHARGMTLVSCDTLAFNGDERFVTIWREGGANSGRLIMLDKDVENAAMNAVWNAGTSIEACLTRCMRLLRDQQDTARER